MSARSSDADEDPRIVPPPRGDERATLVGFLRKQRETFELKCAGLEAAALASRAVPPSSLSLLGMIRHLAEVERGWFRWVMAGQETPRLFDTDDDLGFAGAEADPALVAEAWECWRAEVAFVERFVAEASDLDVTGNSPRLGAVSLRWVLTHLIEEYARHNGHADLLRERIDGTVGE
ncbi:DinB family protein [Amycolatopsis samaneae]|uniref:DinB family protein n=1 Tax=Amycolatopsis samaneae TaxID=664691 RepID=A0ABW5GVP1_9PSEU